AQVEKLFGYRKDELLGQPVELLVPERSRDGHPADRGRFFTAPEVRPMGLGRDLFGRRKGGEEFPVEIGLSPLRTERGLFVLASVIDLTARRRVEDNLRASQRELQRLPGRLLEAQEAERRRIARELHDDLNQSLALLAVEIDALVRKPPADGEFAKRLEEVATQVKDLSTAVHDLSHELHPSKLEHIGLVASVRGLCRDVSLAHGLEVTFTHFPDPGAVPLDASLCLYRLVQEALRNVVKHSGCRHASVELTATADAVHLIVEDDGVGFDPGPGGYTGGLGLVSMRERLHLVGGTIAIDSGPGEGTRIDVRVPVSAAGLTADREPASNLVGT
ncbi:MAG: PAS domain-containing sensor histidine kinase, partial [Gemmataceae bacterium]